MAVAGADTGYRPPITLQQLADRFLAQPPASEQTVSSARRRLVWPLAALGDAQAADVTTEALQRIVTAVPGNCTAATYGGQRPVSLRRLEGTANSVIRAGEGFDQFGFRHHHCVPQTAPARQAIELRSREASEAALPL